MPRFKSKDKGVTIVTMGIAPQLAKDIRALGGRAGLGAMGVKINVRALLNLSYLCTKFAYFVEMGRDVCD